MNDPLRTVLIVANPHSGARDRSAVLREVEDSLTERGLRVIFTESLAEMSQLVPELRHRGELRVVVAAGGDGTVSAVANGLPAEIPVAILPLGTENLLAKYLGMPCDPLVLAETIVSGEQYRMDAGKVADRFYLVVATCGYDADVVRRMERIRKGHITHWTYVGPILRSLWHYRFPRIRVRLETPTGDQVHSVAWLFVFNAPRYATGLPICPDADPTDGWLDVCTFRRSGALWGIWYFLRVLTRTHRMMRDFQHQKAKRIWLDVEPDGQGSPPQVPWLQTDGDVAEKLPARIEVLPGRVCFLKPAQ